MIKIFIRVAPVNSNTRQPNINDVHHTSVTRAVKDQNKWLTIRKDMELAVACMVVVGAVACAAGAAYAAITK